MEVLIQQWWEQSSGKLRMIKGKVHSFILPNTYYSPSVETRLLLPQHWTKIRKKGRDSYCITYHDAIIMR
jgi:hypothetical protein